MAKWFTYSLLGGVFLVASAFTPATRFDGVRPIVLALGDPTPVAGQTVTVTVTLNEASPDNEQLTISSLNLGAFSSIPSSVAVNPGDTQETFQVTLANNFAGLTTVTASSALGQASTMVMIAIPLPK